MRLVTDETEVVTPPTTDPVAPADPVAAADKQATDPVTLAEKENLGYCFKYQQSA